MDPREKLILEFNKDRDLFPIAESIDGPLSSFITDQKASIREEALKTGKLALSSPEHEGREIWPFQDCSPLDDDEQRQLRRELIRVKNIGKILDESLSLDFEELAAADQADRLFLDKFVNEAVLVEASRRAYLSAIGQGKDDIEFCKKMIRQSCEALYPQPSRELALDCLGLFEAKVKTLDQSVPEINRLAREALECYPFLAEAAGRSPQVLDENIQAEVRDLLQKKYQPIFDQLKAEVPEINNSQLTYLTQRFLELSGYSDLGWKVEYVGGKRVGYMVNSQSKTVELGDRTKEITWPAFERLMIHEDVHVARASNGERLGSKGLEHGMLGSEFGEEGLAILREKVWAKTASKKVIDRDQYRYILGSYAAGALDGVAHGPQETFDFAITLKLISNQSRKADAGADFEASTTSARKEMFEHVFRLFRGMPPGCVMPRDLVYFGGYTQMVELFNNTDRPIQELLADLMRGKNNPFDECHQQIMRGYDVQSA